MAKGYFTKFLKSLDSTGSSMGFSIKGNDNFKTVFGGIYSIILYSVCIAYAGYQAYLMFGYQNSTFGF